MMNAGIFRTYVDSLPDFLARSLSELPGKIVAAPMELQILISLKSFVANFADKSVRSHQRFRRQSNHFRIRVWIAWQISLSLHRNGLYSTVRVGIGSQLLLYRVTIPSVTRGSAGIHRRRCQARHFYTQSGKGLPECSL